MHDRKHLCHFGKARGRIDLSMIVTYFQCLTLRVRSGHLSNALTRERSWLTEKLVSPPYQSQSVVDSFTNYTKYPPVTPLWANSTTVRRPLDKMKPKRTGLDIFFFFFYLFYYFLFSSDSSCEEQDIWLHGDKIPSSDPTLGQQYNR